VATERLQQNDVVLHYANALIWMTPSAGVLEQLIRRLPDFGWWIVELTWTDFPHRMRVLMTYRAVCGLHPYKSRI